MTNSPDPAWQVPDIQALLASFAPSRPNLDLIDQRIAEGNVAALRSLFEMLINARNRAEHFSNALLAYIHMRQTQDPAVREHFQTMMADRDTELKSVGLKPRRPPSAGADKADPPSTRRKAPPKTPTGARAPVVADW